MRRSLLRLWLGTGMLGAFLACGCQHAWHSCSTCGAPATRVASAPAVARPTTYAPTVVRKPSVPDGPATPSSEETPVVHTTAKPVSMTPSEVNVITAGRSAPAQTAEEPGMMRTVINPYRDGPVARRTFTDITAHPEFAHDPNYKWLVGRLDYSKFQDAWVLRYASVEEDDRYGGSVTLVDPGRMAGLQNGQMVRVEGHLVDPDDQHLRPPFRAQSIQALQP